MTLYVDSSALIKRYVAEDDALHLAAAERAGGRSVPIVTFDVRLGHAGRSLGWW